jgi:hypothetical protein
MRPLPLNQRLDRIGQHIVRARLFLDLWFYFEERDSQHKIIETIKGRDAAAVDALLVEAKPIAEKVLTLRHEAFDHRSAHISYNDVFKRAAVKPTQLRDLTDMALEIANCLLLARGLQNQYFTELPREAVEEMMTALGAKRPRRRSP